MVRNIGTIEGNRPVTDNAWESITKGGDAAIRRWIDKEMSAKVVSLYWSEPKRQGESG